MTSEGSALSKRDLPCRDFFLSAAPFTRYRLCRGGVLLWTEQIDEPRTSVLRALAVPPRASPILSAGVDPSGGDSQQR